MFPYSPAYQYKFPQTHTHTPCDDKSRPEDAWKVHSSNNASSKLHTTNFSSSLCSKAKQEQVKTSVILSQGEAATSQQAAEYTNNNIH